MHSILQLQEITVLRRKISLIPFMFVVTLGMLAFFAGGCKGEPSTNHLQRATAAETSTPVPTSTPLPTSTATPTATPLPSLRREAKKYNFWIGSSFDAGWVSEDPLLVDMVTREFNMLTPEVAMKWEVIHPERDYYDFRRGDGVVDFARLNGMLVRGHPLVWDFQLPGWVLEAYEAERFTRDEWIDILRGHVKTVAGHYRGEIYAWDVVNEAIADDGSLRDTIWLRTIGPEYIAMTFRWAHEADPYALLFYNDNGGEGMNAKAQAIYELVDGLIKDGVPIHGVGLQMHVALGSAPSADELAQNIQRLSDLGLRVHITEMDVRLQYSSASEEQKLASQSEMYRRVFTVCLQAPGCEAFVTWGPTDRHSWIPGYTGHPDAPLLFDESYEPKPAYDAIMEVLQKGGD